MLFALLLQLLCFTTLATARDKNTVEVKEHEFDGPAANLYYFEDSNAVLIHDRTAGQILRSDDAGKSWDPIDGVEKGKALELWPHPHDKKVAYILGGRNDHWVTKDRGQTWRKFGTEHPPTLYRQPFTFHAGDVNKVLYHGQRCSSNMLECEDVSYYTKDSFETQAEMRKETRGCTYAQATPLFEVKNDDTVICVVKGKYSGWPEDNRLVVSDNYFKDEVEPYLEGERTVQGIINIAPVKAFIVAAAKAKGTTELALYVTKDAQTWHRAVFPSDHKLEQDAYTILESTNYSIQVDVMTTKPTQAMGVLCTSNSNGTYFTRNIEHTNRNFHGLVDFEKVQGIQGIVLVNVVDNFKEVEISGKDKKLTTKISFDDGRTFKSLKADGKDLHLHSVTDMANTGRVFSSPAPGLVMGVGNTGKHLKRYEDCDTWVSDDAGVTWTLALKEAYKYEIGDQGAILVAVYDEGPTDEIKYSIDHGKTWDSVDLRRKVKAHILTTTPDSTSLKFLLLATTGSGEDVKHYSFFLDFESVLERTCDEDKDFEKWYARVDDNNEPDCLMGHKQYYRRRRAEAKCSINHEFKEAKPQIERCACTKEDYECDFNFIRSEDGKTCEPAASFRIPTGVCKDNEETYMGPSGFRLIPGDDCIRRKAVELDKDLERSCNQTKRPPAKGEITHEISSFKASSFREWHYLERKESSSGEDETVIMRTDEKKVYRSKDHGKTWDHVLKGEEITSIYPHSYVNDVVYFLTGSKKAWYSIDRGDNIREFKIPSEPTHDKVRTMAFHPDYKDWLIYTGAEECGGNGECHSVAHITEDRGGSWEILRRYARKCEFIKKEGRGASEKLVYCEQFKDERLDRPLELLSSDNFFADHETKFSNVIDFATMAEFIVVASKDQDEKSLSVAASVDGQTFAPAEFPSNFNVPVQRAYTVLDSSTHAVFLHVTVSSRQDSEFGSIIKSNSNGTSYVLSINAVNRNTDGYVDFEKMLGLEGVAIVNVVDNVEAAESGDAKKLKTMITHNDGAVWVPIRAPDKDTEGHDFQCDVEDIGKCSLHLHGYTERLDPRATYSSPSAVGLMMGVGNVGDHLSRKGEGDSYTFITRDGGFEWKAVKKGAYMWEYGDQGSIIVIVEDKTATDVVFYTLDEGETWTQYQFTESKMEISALTTVPSDTSRNFLLWGRDVESSSEIVTVNLDFTGLWDRQCELNDQHPEESPDYELWEPKHPKSEDNCLFGHIAQYHRKKIDAHCFNGRRYESLHNIKENCSCTRQDFECDFNYEYASDGSCQKVPNLPNPDHSLQCKDNPDQAFYYEPTGYRRIPLTTCEGHDLEYMPNKKAPCPGHEGDFEKEKAKARIGGFWLFILVVVLPITVASAVGYWVYTHWEGMKMGSIRLSSGPSSGGGGTFDAEQPWIKYPVAAVAGMIAVIGAIPLLLGSVWKGVSGLWGGSRGRYSGLGGQPRTYTSRDSFARGRGNYAVVDPDEDELLGEDEDEEV